MLHARLLRYIDEVARCGSIRKAAAKLNVAASAVNRQLIAFEREFGTPIFERLPRKLRLTAAGEVLMVHISATLKGYQGVTEQVESLKQHTHASATVATVSGLAGDMLANALVALRRERPPSRFSVTIMNAEAIPAAVAAGDFDVGFAFDLPDLPAVRAVALLKSRFGAVVLAGHPLAGCASVRLEVLRNYPLILPQQGVSIRDAVDTAAERARLTLRPAIESNNFEFLKNVAMLDQGVAILNEIDVADARRRGNAVFVPITELHGQTQDLSVVHRARGSPGPLAGLLVEHLSSLLRSIGPK